MLALSATARIYLYRVPCDMRKSFDGLCGLVRSGMGEDPLSGSFFVFLNRRRNLLKCLYWDRDGFALYVELNIKGIMPSSGLCRAIGSFVRSE
jgi:transposase